MGLILAVIIGWLLGGIVKDTIRRAKALRESSDEYASELGAMTCSRDEYRAACNAVAQERDDAVRDLAIAEDELRTLRAHRCGLPASIVEALNSGDGTYRP